MASPSFKDVLNLPSMFDASSQSVSPSIPKGCLPASSLAFTVKVVIQFDLVPWSVFLLPDNRTIGSFMFSDPVNFSVTTSPSFTRLFVPPERLTTDKVGIEVSILMVLVATVWSLLSPSLPAMSLKSMLKVVSRSASPAVTV